MTGEFYSVDRRGFYKVGGTLGLFEADPYRRPLYGSSEGWYKTSDLQDHLRKLFPGGLSLHGWEWMKLGIQGAMGPCSRTEA
jgi:hypothetical protein